MKLYSKLGKVEYTYHRPDTCNKRGKKGFHCLFKLKKEVQVSDFHCTIHQKSKNKRKWLFETTAVFKDGELKKKKKKNTIKPRPLLKE